MKNLLLAFALITVSSSAFATAYRCNVTIDLPGRPSYMLIIQDGLPSYGAAVILSQNMSTGTPGWTLIDGNAKVMRIPDGGPLKVTSQQDASKIDWSKPEIKDSCFVPLKTSYWFSLSERTTGVSGTVSTQTGMAHNPNKKDSDCPRILPPQRPSEPLVCFSL